MSYVYSLSCYFTNTMPVTHNFIVAVDSGEMGRQTFFRTARVGWKGLKSFYMALTGFISLKIPAYYFILQNVQTHPMGVGESFLWSREAGA